MKSDTKTCYIVGAGDFFGEISPLENDLVIAADGGYDHLLKRGITPHLLIGDLDSLISPLPSCEIIRHKIEKDETDMHLAYLEGARRGYDAFEIYGGTGGREDHTFANYCLLYYIRNHGGRATLIGRGTRATVIKDESITLRGRSGASLSVFAFGGHAENVCIAGAKYSARGATLTPDFPLGVSNSFLNAPVTVSVGRGALLIISEI